MKAKTILAIVAGLILAGPVARECKATGTFTLNGTDANTVNTPYDSGTLHDDSKAEIVSGGYVGNIDAWENSQVYLPSGGVGGVVGNIAAFGNSLVKLSGGQVNGTISAYNTSTVSVDGGTVSGSIIPYNTSILNITDGYVNYIDTSHSVTSSVSISGGYVDYYWAWSPVNISDGLVAGLAAEGTAHVTISGGAVNGLAATGTNTVAVSGGQVDFIFATDTSILTFDAKEEGLSLGDGLFRSGNQVWGVGELTGYWHDGTSFHTIINGGSSSVVPEPATMVCGLIGLGMIGRYIKKHRGSKARPAHS